MTSLSLLNVVLFSLCYYGAADCDFCQPGTFNVTLRKSTVGTIKGVVCDSCERDSGFRCDGISIGAAGYGNGWNEGQGDIIRNSGDACPKQGANKALTSAGGSYFFMKHSHIPVLRGNGTLEGKHMQFDLGRKGRCPADAMVRLRGQPLHQHDDDSADFAVESVGECCDKCAEAEKCTGWTIDGTKCFLLGALFGTWDWCETCFSGVYVDGERTSIGATFV